jgi:hypothetical protein
MIPTRVARRALVRRTPVEGTLYPRHPRITLTQQLPLPIPMYI